MRGSYDFKLDNYNLLEWEAMSLSVNQIKECLIPEGHNL
jgi:hypothetical protein